MISTGKNIIGIDEAGRGPLIGRVYAGATIWNGEDVDFIKDSKKMTPKRRAIALEWIEKNLIYGVGYADNNEIDEINILNATKLAMDRAIENLLTKVNNKKTELDLYIDGCGWEHKFKNCTSIVKGDDKYYSIAAASIIAKEYHDKHILNLCNNNPDYNNKYDLLKNKGYPTKKHIEGINKYGITEYHRKSFKSCKLFN
jgi:ribonuclease HII